MKRPFVLLSLLAITSTAFAGTISESQQQYIKKYAKQKFKTPPEEALLNTDSEPDITQAGFVELYNGENLDGWIPRGGECTFEASGDKIIGTVIKGSPSTYLSTEREDYSDFILTAELFWVVDSNSGIMIRAKRKPGGKKGFETVYGPQVEMEGFGERGWSGAIYGQGIGGWRYPLWLDAHEEVRGALKENEWNRITILCQGPTIKTWLNGIPAAHWETDEYSEGFISLQIHSGPNGEVHFRDIRILELDPEEVSWTNLFESGDFSGWTKFDGTPVSGGWSVNDGVIQRDGIKPGDIITKESYDDFEMIFDWKISEGGNSGVKYRTKGRLGLEYQILDDVKSEDANKPSHYTASMYELVPADDDKPLKPAGEWNQARILVKGDHVQHWLNGKKVVDTDLASDDWNKRFENSKYKKHKGFGGWKGPILLQDHNDKVWYRNVKIRSL